jgi:hypothetical protein
VLCEGVETALSVWQATGQEVWACLGISNIARAPVPDKATVILAHDGDAPGSRAEGQIIRAATALALRGLRVLIATPPEGEDFNDMLQREGEDAIRNRIAGAEPFRTPDLAQAKKMLADAGYKGEKVVLLLPSDVTYLNAEGLMAAQTLRSLGMNVDVQTSDWATIGARRAKREAPDADAEPPNEAKSDRRGRGQGHSQSQG